MGVLDLKNHYRGGGLYFLPPNPIAGIACALFLVQFIFLLCHGEGMPQTLRPLSMLDHGSLTTRSSSLFLSSIHPEEAISCFHEARADSHVASLECDHEDPLLPFPPMSAPDMIGEGDFAVVEVFRSAFCSFCKIWIPSAYRFSCNPPPRDDCSILSV